MHTQDTHRTAITSCLIPNTRIRRVHCVLVRWDDACIANHLNGVLAMPHCVVGVPFISDILPLGQQRMPALVPGQSCFPPIGFANPFATHPENPGPLSCTFQAIVYH